MCRGAAIFIILAAVAWAQSPRYGVGRTPSSDEIKIWDISIMPDGKGLPEGNGTSPAGAQVYERRCQRCHGTNGQGGDEGPLVGGKGTLNTPKPLKTVGSFWPYATTLFDYVRRAMPYKEPGTLTDDQVYAVTAYILKLNGIITDTEAMNAETLPKVVMPNRNGFIPDARPDTPRRPGQKFWPIPAPPKPTPPTASPKQ